MKFLIHYLGQSSLRNKLFLVLFFCVQFMVQYYCLIMGVKNNCAELNRCLDEDKKVFLKIKKETRVLCDELIKLNNIKNQLKINGSFEEKSYLLLSALKSSSLITKNITSSHRCLFSVVAEGDFEGLIKLLTEFVRHKNLIATYFFVEKFEQKQKLSFYINVVTT